MRTTLLVLASLVILVLDGCSGGGSSGGGSSAGTGVSQSVTAQSIGGIYRGKLTSASGAVLDSLLIVSEDGRFISATEDPTSHCANVAQGSMIASGATLSGGGNFGLIDYTTVPAVETDCLFSDGSYWGTSSVSGSYVTKTSMTLSSTNTTSLSTVMPVSPLTSTYDTLYNESSDLSKTAGNWTDQTGTVISIDGNGVIFSQQSSTGTGTGCVLNGQLSVIDPLYDVYTTTVTFSNCQFGTVDLNGTTALGLVSLNDKVVPNVLYIGYTLNISTGVSFMVYTVATRT